MPQHPVYMKLGINKYYIKNQHLGLNALIHLFPISFFFPSDDFSPIECLHKSWTQLERCNSHTFLSDCSVSELILKKELLKSPLGFIYLFCTVVSCEESAIHNFIVLIIRLRGKKKKKSWLCPEVSHPCQSNTETEVIKGLNRFTYSSNYCISGSYMSVLHLKGTWSICKSEFKEITTRVRCFSAINNFIQPLRPTITSAFSV